MECENGSTCVEEDGGAVCVCPPGATGERCEQCKLNNLQRKCYFRVKEEDDCLPKG